MKRLVLLATVALSFTSHAFDLQGHRGARGLAPENTLAAFEHALSLGVSTLELDIGLSSDGVPVVAHDPFLPPDMTRNAKGSWVSVPTPLIHRLSIDALEVFDVGRAKEGSNTARNFPEQKARDGQRIPTLAAVFARVKAMGADQVRFNIETKTNPAKPDETATPEEFVKALLAVIQEAGVSDRVSIQSFDWRTLKLAQLQAPAIPTVYLTVKNRNTDSAADPLWTAGMRLADYESVPHMVKAAGGATWSPNYGTLTQESVKMAQGLGLKVIPWTVNEPADLQRLIGWNVDGIITDYPDRLRSALQAEGRALPAPLVMPAGQ